VLLGRHTFTIYSIKLGRNLNKHSILPSHILPILPTILGGQTCTSDLITLGWNIIYVSILTYALRQPYFYKWFDQTWQEQNVSIPSLRQNYCTSDSITLGRNLINHCILANAVRQTYLYKWFVHTWQQLHVSFHFGLRSYADKWFDHTCQKLIPSLHFDHNVNVQVIRLQLAVT
jgi:hypothetical protein